MANKDINKYGLTQPVDVICYGSRKHFETRSEAVDLYRKAIRCCEGAERERYMKIYLDLLEEASPVVSDGEPEIITDETVSKVCLSKDEMIKLISENKLSINSKEVYDIGSGELVVEDRDVIKALLKQDGWYAAQFLRKYIENDKELITAAFEGGEEVGHALAYAGDELCDDKDFVLGLIKRDASEIQHVSERLANDVEVVACAMKYATSDFDMECIKESIGNDLLGEMVRGWSEICRDVVQECAGKQDVSVEEMISDAQQRSNVSDVDVGKNNIVKDLS